nr:MAG TPA: hypothetical protein [Caudoviricetes sp.]
MRYVVRGYKDNYKHLNIILLTIKKTIYAEC